METLARWIMRGPVEATGVAVLAGALSWLLPPVIYLGSGALALLGMQLGARRALAVALAATGLLGVFGWVALGHPWGGLLTGLFALVPLALLGEVVRRSGTLTTGLQAATALALVVALLAWLLPQDPVAWWSEQLAALLTGLLPEAREQGLDPADLEATAAVMPGLIGALLLLGLFISMILGRWWQALLYNPGGFRQDFRSLRLGRGLVLVVAAAAALGLAGVSVAANLALVGVAGMAFHGLAVLHAMVARLPQGALWLVPLYVLLVFALPYASIMLATVAALDTAMDLRGRVGSGDA